MFHRNRVKASDLPCAEGYLLEICHGGCGGVWWWWWCGDGELGGGGRGGNYRVISGHI